MSFCVTKDITLQRSALQFLFRKNPVEEPNGCLETLGGVLSSLNYAWLVNGSRFIIVSCKNGARVGSWNFGNTLQDDTSEIIGIEEIQRPHGKEPLLAISINCDTSGGIICIFDFIGSKVIRAIQIGEHISSLHVIDSGQDIFNLSGPLRNFDGIFAVGTVGGNVYIVDICWQLCYEGFGTLQARDELNPCQMLVVTSEDLADIENHKKSALRNESHLTIHLNAVQDNTTQHFVLKEPSGADKVHVNKQEVLISTLHYCSQLGSILVGYNFGAFQLWNLMRMELIYTSPICDDHVPISMFAVQEPADDPRAFCYIWAVYSSDDLHSSLLPYLVMYALCYESKEFHESYGILYENFQYCAVRFHMELAFNNQSVVNPAGGKCLRLESLVHKNSISNSEMGISDGLEDVLSLCVVIWQALSENGQFTYMAVFDLNQWYKAQMPNSLNVDDCSSYMITLCVSDLIDSAGGSADIHDVAVNKKSICQFMGTQRLEEHYHPSSLSFDTYCLMENRSVVIQYQGIQKALLYQLQSSGPLCLIRPTEIYQEIVSLGLTPLFVEISTSPASSHISLNNQRETILNVALEQQLISWLCKCASEWANGSFSSAGCSLELLTSWAFRRGLVLKNNCDKICVPLFDYSEVRLDTNTANILNNCIRQIKNISFFQSFVIKNLSTHVINKDSLAEQCHTLQMVEVYFDVLQWLFNVGLLPEYASSSFIENIFDNKIRAPYPAEKLMQYYKKRRSELLLLLNKRFCSETSILFIDNLIDVECGGEQLWKEWKSDGGDGFYPPISLQALLRTYLMDDIEVCNKHAVVIYLFLDLAMILDPKKYASVITHLIKFPAVFKVSPSLIKITQAFWQLDHGDFSTAMEQLLDPLVNQDDLKYWHHKVALKSLLVQEQPNSALLYMHVRKPPILDDEDVLCALSLFISNNMLDEAFYMEKNYKNHFNSKKFINHLFTECSNYGRLSSIIYRNLSDEEEKIFLQYLDDVKHPEAADLKITYFMQRSHYIEAFKTYQSCEEDPSKRGLLSRLNSTARDQIIHSYKKLLPTVSYKFIESCTVEPNPIFWKEVSRVEPLSVTFHGTEEKPEYKSSLIFAALAKAKQTFNGGVHNLSSLLNATTEEIPFLRTPTRPSSRKRSSVQVILPKVLNEEEEDGPSPKKKPKMSPRSTSLLSRSNISMESSILNTPMIIRKQRREISPIPKASFDLTATPTSILKVKHSFIEEGYNDNISSPNHIAESSKTILNSEQGISHISGRKSISRTSTVRFDVPKSSTSSEEQSSSLIKSNSLPVKEVGTPKTSNSNSLTNSSKNISPSFSPKQVSESDDVFYSPNSSLNNIEEIPKDEEDIQLCNLTNSSIDKHTNDEQNENTKSVIEDSVSTELSLKISPEKPAIISEAKLVKLVDYELSSSSRENTPSNLTSSPSARRSYKKLPNEQSSVRSSPRLSRSLKLNSSERVLESEKTSISQRERGGSGISTPSSDKTMEEGTESKEFSLLSEPIKPRKSLSRRVLENNAFSRLSSYSENVDNSITKGFYSEQKDISAVSDNKKSELTCTITAYADAYKKQSSEEYVEQHTTKTSFSSVRETLLDSDQDLSILSLIDTPKKSGDECILSNSFMEELVENLRQQRCQENSSFNQTESPSLKENSSNILKEETPPRITRGLSRRLSMDRTLLSEDKLRASPSKRDKKRLSEDRTISSSDASFKTMKKKDIASTRISRRLSTERAISATEELKSSEADEEKPTPTRASRRLSAERFIPSNNDSESSKSNEERVHVLNFTSRSRISRRLSAENSQSANSKTEVNVEEAPHTRYSKRLTPERTISFPHDSQSYTPDIGKGKSDTPSLTASPKISTRLSVERTMSSGNESQSDSQTDVKIIPQRFSRRLSAERMRSSEDISHSSAKTDSEHVELVKVTPKLKCRRSLGRQVLENNTISRLISDYQCADKQDDPTGMNQSQLDVESSLELHSNLNSPSLDKNNLPLSDSLLEEIFTSELSSDKILPTCGQIFEDKNEKSSIANEVESPQLPKIKVELIMNEPEKESSHPIEISSRTSLSSREEFEENSAQNEQNLGTFINLADITDDLDTVPENHTQDEKNSSQTRLIQDVDNDKSNSQQRKTTVKGNNKNEALAVNVNSENTENLDGPSQVNEAGDGKIPTEDNVSEGTVELDQDFSMVYEDLSNESIKQNDPEMNIFEISDDLSLRESMGEKDTNFPESELTSDLNIMMQESPLPSVFERNIRYSISSASDDDVEEKKPDENILVFEPVVKDIECINETSENEPQLITNPQELTESKETLRFTEAHVKNIEDQLSQTIKNQTTATTTDNEVKPRDEDIPHCEMKTPTGFTEQNVGNSDKQLSQTDKNEGELTAQTTTATEVKRHVENKALNESQESDIQIINQTSKNEEQLGFTVEQANNSGEQLSQTDMSESEISSMENSQEKGTEIRLSISSEEQPKKNKLFKGDKRSIELQTGKSLLEIRKEDKDDVIQTIQDDTTINRSGKGDKIVSLRRTPRKKGKFLEESNKESAGFEHSASLKKTDVLDKQELKEAPILLRSHRSRLSIGPASPSQVNLDINLPIVRTSISKTVRTYCRKRTRSIDASSLELSNDLSASTSRMTDIQPIRRKLRSASVDSSIDLDVISETSEPDVKKPSSLSDVEVIEEKRKTSRRKPVKVVKRNLIERYSMARRLTRRQSNILESTLREVDEEGVENDIDLTSIEPNNRIEWLDKSNFEGTPDPEEEKTYETSPSSVGMSSSVSNTERVRRLSRSSSNASEHSKSHSEVSAPKKTRSLSGSVVSPKLKASRIRLRSASADEKEDVVVKIRRSKKSSADVETKVASDDTLVIPKKSRKSSNPKRSKVSENSSQSGKRKGGRTSSLSSIKEEN